MAVREGSLSGRLAMVTGGGGGIGAAICRALADKGARVVTADISLDAARMVAADLPGPADHRALYVDVSDATSVEELFNAIRGFSEAPATILVNCFAKSMGFTPFEEITEEMFDSDIRINLKGEKKQSTKMTSAGGRRQVQEHGVFSAGIYVSGTFLVCQAAVRAILEAGLTEGAIVNISSQAVQHQHRGLCGYITAKGGIEALTRSMALELAEHGILCNCVAPGFTDTPKAAETLSEEFRRSLVKRSRLGRIARPEEIANVVAFLCSTRKFLRCGNSNECWLTYRPREFGIDHARKSNVKHMNRKSCVKRPK